MSGYAVPIYLPRRRRIITPGEWLREKVADQQRDREATITMAAVTNAVTPVGSTLNQTTYALTAFTPVANDLLVCMVVASDTIDAGAVTSTGNTAAWTKITSGLFSTSLNTIYLFVQNALCAATSTAVTFACAGDPATGAIVAVARISGMTLTGSSAVRQTAKLENQTVATLGNAISSPTLAAAALTGNPTLEFMGNNQGDTFNPPASWTELSADTTYITPTVGFEGHSRDAGFTGTNTGWVDTTGKANVGYASILAEFDTSAGAAAKSLVARSRSSLRYRLNR